MYRLVPTDGLAERSTGMQARDAQGCCTECYLYTWPTEPWAHLYLSRLYPTLEQARRAQAELFVVAETHEDSALEGRSDWWGAAIVRHPDMVTEGNHWLADGLTPQVPTGKQWLADPDYAEYNGLPPYYGFVG